MQGHPTTIIVRLILEENEQLLFLKKTHHNGGGFSLVGGKVESHETGDVALIRESFEEANIEIKKKHLRLVHVFQRRSHNEIVLLFFAKKWKGEMMSKEREKFKDLVWFNKHELPHKISPVTNHLIQQYLSGMFFSEDFLLQPIE